MCAIRSRRSAPGSDIGNARRDHRQLKAKRDPKGRGKQNGSVTTDPLGTLVVVTLQTVPEASKLPLAPAASRHVPRTRGYRGYQTGNRGWGCSSRLWPPRRRRSRHLTVPYPGRPSPSSANARLQWSERRLRARLEIAAARKWLTLRAHGEVSTHGEAGSLTTPLR